MARQPHHQTEYSFDSLFLKRFLRLHSTLFPGLLCRASGLLLLLVLLCGAEQLLAYHTGLLSGLFLKVCVLLRSLLFISKVLGERDMPGFQTACVWSLGTILLMVTAKSLRLLATTLLSVAWRSSLSSHLHQLLLGPRHPHYGLLSRTDLDNPDQRLTADCSSLTTAYSGLVPDLLVVPPTTVFYLYQAWARAGWLGPTAMAAYFLVSTVINKVLMGPVVRLTASLQQREGDLRYKHMSLRNQAESLAFLDSALEERRRVEELLGRVTMVQASLGLRNLPIDFSVNLFGYLGAVASYLVVAVPIFGGDYSHLQPADLAQVISETAFVNLYLVSQVLYSTLACTCTTSPS